MKKLDYLRIIALIMVFVMAISFGGCGDKDDSPDVDVTTGQTGDVDSSVDGDKTDEEQDNEQTLDEKDSNENQTNTDADKPSQGQSQNNSAGSDSKEEETKEKSLKSILSAVYADIEDLPRLGNTTLDDDNFSAFAFIDRSEGMKGIASEALIGSIAHSVVAIRVPEGESVKDVANAVKANANPRKWVCVEAEKTIVKYHKQTVLLIMTSEKAADKIAANFDALY